MSLLPISSHSVVIDQPVYEYLHQWTDLPNPAKGSKDQVKKDGIVILCE